MTTALANAGVMIASAVTGPPGGTVRFAYASGLPSRPAGDPNHIAAAVTGALALPKHIDDAAKLAASGVPDRHLFLWVDPLTRPDIGRALNDGIPSVYPSVDTRITGVWLGLPAGGRCRGIPLVGKCRLALLAGGVVGGNRYQCTRRAAAEACRRAGAGERAAEAIAVDQRRSG